ncbi:MAG: hypothetical protein A4E69_02529 [Syntrophus sp. PtaB.Bin138]|nr:MAG: hypothetical protein A4E69_02529 [Syntrophus sp. PtaB.Bin138]
MARKNEIVVMIIHCCSNFCFDHADMIRKLHPQENDFISNQRGRLP